MGPPPPCQGAAARVAATMLFVGSRKLSTARARLFLPSSCKTGMAKFAKPPITRRRAPVRTRRASSSRTVSRTRFTQFSIVYLRRYQILRRTGVANFGGRLVSTRAAYVADLLSSCRSSQSSAARSAPRGTAASETSNPTSRRLEWYGTRCARARACLRSVPGRPGGSRSAFAPAGSAGSP